MWLVQLLYVPQPPHLSKDLQWSTYTWRRGTVPIWWGVEIKSGGVGEATIVVSNQKPYRGTRRLAALNPCTAPHNTPHNSVVCCCDLLVLTPSLLPLN